MKKCTRDWHDCYGEDYEKCGQCFVRDNSPWPQNPLLQSAKPPKTKKGKKRIK